jgi:hypothetical protein
MTLRPLALILILLCSQRTLAQGAEDARKGVGSSCYIDIAELVQMLRAHSSPVEHYHKVKGLYTWPATTRTPVEIEGTGRLGVTCE